MQYPFLVDHRCDDGKCVSLNASPPSDQLSVYHIVLIAAGTGVFTILGIIIIGAIYWHRKQMKIMETPYNALASFSKSTDTSTRSGSSVGFRARTSPEASVNIHIPSITNTQKCNISFHFFIFLTINIKNRKYLPVSFKNKVIR